MAPKLFVPKECADGETRVAVTPDSVKRLLKAGFAVEVESGAGDTANIADSAYEAAGATIAKDAKAAWGSADVVAKINPPAQNPKLGADEATLMREGAILVSHIWAHKNLPVVRTLLARKVSTLALELVPRISRAQSMDTLSSASQHRRLQGRAARCRPARQVLPDAHDRSRHDSAGARGDHGRGRRGPSGHRDGQAPGRRGRGQRHSPRDQGAGRVAGREVHRAAAARERLGPGRLRPGSHARVLEEAAGDRGRTHRRRRRGDHDRAGARPPGAEARHRSRW